MKRDWVKNKERKNKWRYAEREGRNGRNQRERGGGKTKDANRGLIGILKILSHTKKRFSS